MSICKIKQMYVGFLCVLTDVNYFRVTVVVAPEEEWEDSEVDPVRLNSNLMVYNIHAAVHTACFVYKEYVTNIITS